MGILLTVPPGTTTSTIGSLFHQVSSAVCLWQSSYFPTTFPHAEGDRIPSGHLLSAEARQMIVDLGTSVLSINWYLHYLLGQCLRTELLHIQFSFQKLENHQNQIPTHYFLKCLWMATLTTPNWGNAKFKLVSATISHSSFCKNYPTLSIFSTGPISSSAQWESRSLNEQWFNNFSFCHWSRALFFS